MSIKLAKFVEDYVDYTTDSKKRVRVELDGVEQTVKLCDLTITIDDDILWATHEYGTVKFLDFKDVAFILLSIEEELNIKVMKESYTEAKDYIHGVLNNSLKPSLVDAINWEDAEWSELTEEEFEEYNIKAQTMHELTDIYCGRKMIIALANGTELIDEFKVEFGYEDGGYKYVRLSSIYFAYNIKYDGKSEFNLYDWKDEYVKTYIKILKEAVRFIEKHQM